MAAQSASKKVVYAALIGNLLIAATKFVAAFWTGGSAMLSEAIHSLVDTGNEVLLLYGMHRASRPPDEVHPMGHARELYFWSFVVALLIFAVGAGVSLYEGIVHIQDPEPMEAPVVNYVVLGLSLLFESGSWWVAYKEFRASKGDLGWFEAVRRSKDPPGFIVLFEDSAALIGLVIAFLATFLAVTFEDPRLDGAGSIAIAFVLAGVAAVLTRESKGLLIGERARPQVADQILAIARAEPGVENANGVVTLHLGPHQIVAALSLDFADERTAADVERAVQAIEEKVRACDPDVYALFVKPQTAGTYAQARARFLATPDTPGR